MYSLTDAAMIQLGQTGNAFMTGASSYTPPSGMVVVAMTMIADVTFDSGDATTAESSWSTDAQGGIGTGGVAWNQTAFPKGVTIYGRWTAVGIDSGSIMLYVGP